MYYDLECFEGDKKNYIHAYANRIDQIQQYIVWEGHFTVKGKIPLRQPHYLFTRTCSLWVGDGRYIVWLCSKKRS